MGEICIEHLPHQIINWLLGRRGFPRFCLITVHVKVKHLPGVRGGYLLARLLAADSSVFTFTARWLVSTQAFHENKRACCWDAVYAKCPRLWGSNVNKERRGWPGRLLGAEGCGEGLPGSGCALRSKLAERWPVASPPSPPHQLWKIFSAHLLVVPGFSAVLGGETIPSPGPLIPPDERVWFGNSRLSALCYLVLLIRWPVFTVRVPMSLI